MESIAEEEAREEALARTVLGSRPLPDGIHDYRIEFGDDHEGDPAMWIWLDVEDIPHPSPEWIDSVLKFTQSSRDELLAKNLKYRPFFRLCAFQCWQAIHATNNAKAFVTALLLDRHWRRD